MKEKISITINKNLLKNVDALVDNIYIRNRSQAIEHLLSKIIGLNKTAVVLCGGDEKKLKITEKEYCITARIGKDTVFSKALKNFRKNNFKTIFLIARHNILTEVFKLYGDGSSLGLKINYIEEHHSDGTLDSLKLLKDKVNTTFLVVFGDIIFDEVNINRLMEDHSVSSYLTTIMLTSSKKPSEKGNVIVEGSKILEFIQKPKKSDNYIVFSPLFVTTPDILNYPGHSLELDVFPVLAKTGLLGGYLSPVKEKHIHSKKDLR